MNFQKPTEINAHFKYRCPNKDCFNEHWLSLKEVSIINFKVVCEYCGIIFSPYPIVKVCAYYTKDIDFPVDTEHFILKKYKNKKDQTENIPVESITEDANSSIEIESVDETKRRFTETMGDLGFSDDKEVSEMFDRAYTICPTSDIKVLFKIAVLES